MAKTITRKVLKQFGANGNASNFGQFGSLVAGAPLNTKDIPTIQNLPAWLNGLQDAVFGTNKAPLLEDINGLFLVLCYQLAYILQEGMCEWDSSTTYFVGSVVRKPGTTEAYISLVNDNLNNALPNATSNSNWQYMAFFSANTAPSGSVTDSAITALSAGKLTGQVSNSQISDLAAGKITGQIGTSQVADGAITSPKLAAGVVGKIGPFTIPAQFVSQNSGTVTLLDFSGAPGIFQSVGWDGGSINGGTTSGGSNAGKLNFAVIIDGTTFTYQSGNITTGFSGNVSFGNDRNGFSLSGSRPMMFKNSLKVQAFVNGAGDGRNGANMYAAYQYAG